LYEKSTHFLLEIIQNADDNTYNTSTPTLSFSYKPGSLRIDCNEVGFTADNVEAICAINRSTKSAKKTAGEYIGEKGIGFKSVFKAADVVWISSREFKFDQSKFLGMVTPI
jgi:HSP90 family molecular chaperone